MGFKKTLEDDALWRAVTASVQPLGGVKRPGLAKWFEKIEDTVPDAPRAGKYMVRAPIVLPQPVKMKSKVYTELSHGTAPGVDRRTAMKLHRGQMPIQGRLDLHGRTQNDAYRALTTFIDDVRSAGRRSVLVITGKGQGVLKNAVPRWLNQPPLRAHVLSFGYAQKKDGGTGALYILLRKSQIGGRRTGF